MPGVVWLTPTNTGLSSALKAAIEGMPGVEEWTPMGSGPSGSSL